jgi:putative ABC transport system substrate-binding protein
VKRSVYDIIAHILVLSLLIWIWIPTPGNAWGAARIAVLYPEVREPYLSVFNNIIHSIESRNNGSVFLYALPNDFDPSQVETWLDSQQPDAVIALGTRGFHMAQKLKNKVPVLVGAVLLSPNGLPGISMAADPAAMFSNLKQLAPQTRRVFVVYAPTESGWLINQAQEAARRDRLQLIALPVEDLREAVTAYRDLIKNRLGSTDAVWLTTDDVSANERAILPLLLEAAWNKSFILFSNKPSHAKQGALFSMFPDHVGLGLSLADMADQISRRKDPPRMIPTKDLHTAVNLRTAAHLGLIFSSEQQNSFQLKFP